MLGAHGGRGENKATTSLMVSDTIVIDAGNIMAGLGDAAGKIDYIFLTHCHLDHIVDMPFLIDAFYTKREKPITVFGLKETLASLKNHILNWEIWPDFHEITLIDSQNKSILLQEISIGEVVNIDGYSIKAVKTNHSVPSCGYVVGREGKEIFFTSDTYICDEVWREANENTNITSMIIDCSFPSEFEKLALDSKHLTPKLLSEEIKKLNRSDIQVYVFHIKPSFEAQIKTQLSQLEALSRVVILRDGDRIFY